MHCGSAETVHNCEVTLPGNYDPQSNPHVTYETEQQRKAQVFMGIIHPERKIKHSIINIIFFLFLILEPNRLINIVNSTRK